MILLSIFKFDESTPFPSRYTLVPVLGTALVILFSRPGSWVWAALSIRPLAGIGLISCSAYLWHQPLFAFARLRSLTEPSTLVMTGPAVASLILAWLTWRYVEQPFRARGLPTFRSRNRVFHGSGALAAMLVICGANIVSSNGFTWRGDRSLNLSDLDTRMSLNLGVVSECEGQEQYGCDEHSGARTVLFGDSFAMHLAQGIMASAPDQPLRQYALSACAPIHGVAPLGGDHTRTWSQGCMEFNDAVYSIVENEDIDLVVLSSSFEFTLDGKVITKDGKIVYAPELDLIAKQMLETIQRIQDTGARVVIVSPTPESGWNIGHCISRIALFNAEDDSCNFQPQRETKPIELVELISDHVPVYALEGDICEDCTGHLYQDGVYLYRDKNHLSKGGVTLILANATTGSRSLPRSPTD